MSLMQKARQCAALAAVVSSLSCSMPAMPETQSVLQREPETPSTSEAYVTELTPENFDEFVLDSDIPVVVDFYTEWCPPCRQLKPVYEQSCRELQGKVRCAAFDAYQDYYGISGSYGVDGFPTLVPFCRGIQGEELHWLASETLLMEGMEELVDSCQ